MTANWNHVQKSVTVSCELYPNLIEVDHIKQNVQIYITDILCNAHVNRTNKANLQATASAADL